MDECEANNLFNADGAGNIGKKEDIMKITEAIKSIEERIAKLKERKEKEIKELTETFDNKIRKLEITIEVNKEVNTYECPKCNGRGFYRKLDDAGIESESVKCEKCKGTGRVSRS